MKLVMMANTDWYLYNFRMPIAARLRERGWEVILASPKGEYVSRFQEQGFRWLPVNLSRRGIFLPSEGNAVREITRTYRQENPDLVHHFTMKPVLYGSLAARMAGVEFVVNTVAGLGYLFISRRIFTRVLRYALVPLFRYALSLEKMKVIFENEADRRYFVDRGLISKKKTTLIQGAGVDLDKFRPSEEPDGPCAVLMASRLLWDKGVREFVEAAKLVRAVDPQVRFILVGEPDPGNPSSVTSVQVNAWADQGLLEWWGHRSDMPSVYRQIHVVALPSYSEGVPTVLLEAAACGRPIVATDIPGCRAVVRDGETGLLVPPRNSNALAEAIKELMGSPELRDSMGRKGRALMERRFDQDRIVDETVSVYEQLIAAR